MEALLNFEVKIIMSEKIKDKDNDNGIFYLYSNIIL